MRREFFSNEIHDLFQAGNLPQIVSRCQEILGDLRVSGNEDHPDVALLLDHIARAYFQMRDFQAAIEATKEVLRIDCSQLGEQSADYVRNVSNLGFLYVSTGRV